MPMNVPGAARQVFEDRGEQLDASQILLVGGSIAAGQTYNNQLYGQSMAADTLSATGTTIATALQLTTPLARVTTVTGATQTGVALPAAIRGMEVTVVNDGTTTLSVYPFNNGTDFINALAAGAAFTIASALSPTIFFCFSNGQWRTK